MAIAGQKTIVANGAEPPNCNTWKSEFVRRVTSKKISEEFEYFAKSYEKLIKAGLPSSEAVLFALEHASKQKPLQDPAKRVSTLPEGSKVCIVGAGMSGLYIAMILDALAIPNLSYEILEGSGRVGGRVYTYKFSDVKHDYYDVGAMRFPDIPIMDKTFKLFDHLKIPKLPYYMSSPRDHKTSNQPSRYNDKTHVGNIPNRDVFEVSELYGGRIMPELVQEPDKYVTEAFEPFKSRLRANWTKGFNALMKYDEFTVRGFMMSHGITPLDDYYSIQWLETLTDGSGLYDQGFAEGVIDSMDFDYYTNYIDKKNIVSWYCVDGGTSVLPETMKDQLKIPLTDKNLNKRVTKIALHEEEGKDSFITVSVDNETAPRKYMTVFATPTLACLQRIDLTDLKLLYEQKDAIRSLHYDTASKVGMKFKYAWWIKYGIEGGLGKTDMPLRTCVYPSYNLDDYNLDNLKLDDPEDEPAVLLCSYSWAQDAARLGSLMKGDPKKETELVQMLMNNLTWLHLENAKLKDSKMTFEKLHKEINNAYITHHAFDWHNDPFTSGAYGKFGAGQFSNLYPALTCPTADSRFHFVGEAVSAHHGWIVGALDSAHQAVINFLRRFNLKDYEDKLKDIPWLGKAPDEIDKETAVKQVLLGTIDPEKRMEARVAVEKGKTEVLEVEKS